MWGQFVGLGCVVWLILSAPLANILDGFAGVLAGGIEDFALGRQLAAQLDDAVTSWDKTMRKFRQAVLDTVQQRIRRDKTLKDIQTACDPIIVYAEWSEGEVKLLRGLLETWRNYRDMVVSYADAWGNTRVGY